MMAANKPRWYFQREDHPHGRVQVESHLTEMMRQRRGFTLPEPILRLAQAEYERQCGTKQDYERMQERAGLGLLEVVALLADYVERLGGTPTEPRSSGSNSDA